MTQGDFSTPEQIRREVEDQFNVSISFAASSEGHWRGQAEMYRRSIAYKIAQLDGIRVGPAKQAQLKREIQEDQYHHRNARYHLDAYKAVREERGIK